MLRNSRIALLNIVKDLESAQKQEQTLRLRVSEMNRVLEEEIQSRTSQVRKLLEQKDAFVDKLGHDLKTPLTPLVALLPLLRNRCGSDQEVLEMFDVLISNVQYIRKLVDEVLALADLDEPVSDDSLEKIDVGLQIRPILASLAQEAISRKVRIDTVDLDGLLIRADRALFGQLIEELVSNAVKYSRAEGGQVEIRGMQLGKRVQIQVRDDGIGMDPQTARQAFDEFFKADEARHDRNSVGLGLSICKHIVEKHGGSIRIESPGRDRGVCVHVILPALAPEPDTTGHLHTNGETL
jgi:signal transduction histidine kinase